GEQGIDFAGHGELSSFGQCKFPSVTPGDVYDSGFLCIVRRSFFYVPYRKPVSPESFRRHPKSWDNLGVIASSSALLSCFRPPPPPVFVPLWLPSEMRENAADSVLIGGREPVDGGATDVVPASWPLALEIKRAGCDLKDGGLLRIQCCEVAADRFLPSIFLEPRLLFGRDAALLEFGVGPPSNAGAEEIDAFGE